MNNFGIPEATLNKLLRYFKSKPEIEKVLIYGSRAKGTYHNGSDIDFAIWTTGSENSYKIAGELYDLSTPYKFDVIDYKSLTHEGIKKSIEQDGKLFYQR